MPTFELVAKTPDRLDKAVAGLLPSVTRSAAQRLIEQAQVTVNGEARDAAHTVRAGDVIVVTTTEPQSSIPEPEAISLDVLYEDADVLAINKPAGMVVHPGVGNVRGTLVSAVLHHAPEVQGVGGDAERPGIVHRLDKETSGVVLVAKSEAALLALKAQFKAREIHKTYVALLVGNVQPPRAVITKRIGLHPANRQRMAVVGNGREAVTEYVVSDTFALPGVPTWTYSLVRAHPLTGRTHQLRVHFASIGFPIVGDAHYGAKTLDPLGQSLTPRHLLHAREISFRLPSSGETMTLIAPLPDDFTNVLAGLQTES